MRFSSPVAPTRYASASPRNSDPENAVSEKLDAFLGLVFKNFLE